MKPKQLIALLLAMIIILSLSPIELLVNVFAGSSPYLPIYGKGTYSDPADYRQIYAAKFYDNGARAPKAYFSVIDASDNSIMVTSASDNTTVNVKENVPVGKTIKINNLSTVGSGSSIDMVDFQITKGGRLIDKIQSSPTDLSNYSLTLSSTGVYNFYLCVRDDTSKAFTDKWGNWSYNGAHRAIGLNYGLNDEKETSDTPETAGGDDFWGYWYYTHVQVSVVFAPDFDIKYKGNVVNNNKDNPSEKDTVDLQLILEDKTVLPFAGDTIATRKWYYWDVTSQFKEITSSMTGIAINNNGKEVIINNCDANLSGSDLLGKGFKLEVITKAGVKGSISKNTYFVNPPPPPPIPGTASIFVYYIDITTRLPVHPADETTYRDKPYGTYSIEAKPAPAGYKLDASTPSPQSVTVDAVNNFKKVTFYYSSTSGGSSGKLPTAVITGLAQKMAGESITFSGSSSFDPDGTIVDYIWNISGSNHIYTEPSKRSTRVWYPTPGEYDLDLTVVDNDGLTGDCMTSIKITPPVPTASIDFTGKQKENRKVIVNGSNSYSPAYYPINKYSWSMTNGADSRYIGAFGSDVSKEMLFKKGQQYSFTLKVDNTFGLSDTETKVLAITPDLAPVADFDLGGSSSSIAKVVRNPQDSNYATINATNLSRSVDGDPIKKTALFYAYDSNNDSNFDNEIWYYSIDGSNWIASGLAYSQLDSLDLYNLDGAANLSNFVLKTQKVGKYKFEAKTIEDIPTEDTIPQFLTPQDYKSSMTITSKPINSKIVEVINTAPTVSFEIRKKKPLDLIIVTDYSGTKLSQLQSEITVMETKLRALNIDTKVSIITNKVPVATQTAAKYEYYRDLHFIRHIMEAEGTNYSCYPPGEFRDEGFRLETIQDYEKPASEIPVNVQFGGSYQYIGTYGTMYGRSYGSTYRIYHSAGYYDLGVTIWYNDTSGYYRWYKDWHIEQVYADPSFKKGYFIRTDTFTVNNMDVNGIKNISLRENSDRYVMLLSDGKTKDYSKSFGETFSLGNLTQELKDYIKNNNMKIYSVLDTKTMNSTLLNEIIVDVDGAAGMSMQRTAAGDVWIRNMSGKVYKIDESVLGKVKTVMKPNLVVFESGVVKYFDGETIKPFPISNVTATHDYMYNSLLVASGGTFYVLDPTTLFIRETHSGFETITGFSSWEEAGDLSLAGVLVLTTGQAYRLVDTNINRDTDGLFGTYREPMLSGQSIKETYSMRYVVSYYLTRTGSLYRRYWDGATSNYKLELVDTNVAKTSFTSGSYNGSNCFDMIYLKADGTIREDYPVVVGQHKKRDGDDVYWVNTYGNTGFKSITSPVKFNDIVSLRMSGYGVGSDNKLYKMVSGVPTLEYNDIKGIEKASQDYVFFRLANGNLYSKRHSVDGWGTPTIESKVYTNVDKVAIAGRQVSGAALDEPLLLYNNGTTNINVMPVNITLINPATVYMTVNKFISGSPYNKAFGAGQYAQALNDIAGSYLADPSYSTNYILVNDEVEVKTYYSDYENDPKYKEYWTYKHDQFHFEIPMGLASFHGKTVNVPITKFDKTGKYAIDLKIKDNPQNQDAFNDYRLSNVGIVSLNLFVHRKPVALLKISISPNGGKWHVQASDAGSYDLDHISAANKGITASEWAWKEQYEVGWHNERMNKTDCDAAKVYSVRYRVRDIEGVWSDYNTIEIDNDNPPVALFTIDKNPLPINEYARIKDQSYTQSFSTITSWHWKIKKLNEDGSTPFVNIQNSIFPHSNKGTGGYDENVKTDFSDTGTGTYRLYLRVKDSNGLWSDGGTDGSFSLDDFYCQDLVVQESFKISNFRVVQVKDLHLESFYYNRSTGQYDDIAMGVNEMAIDWNNFSGMLQGLTKGYSFQFELDTVNFNGASDQIVITPHFYTCSASGRDAEERELYWENSDHEIFKAGEGAHQAWAEIALGMDDRTIGDEGKATWRGSYLIPGTAWAVPKGTTMENAVYKRIDKDIIVSFEIKGYRDGELKFDYNLEQWPLERENSKWQYEIGDVIRYDHTKCNLDDNKVILNRP